MAGVRNNLVLRTLKRILDAEGIPFTVRHGGKHPYLSFTVGGHRVRYPFPASTGDRRSHLAASTTVCRIVRQMKQER